MKATNCFLDDGGLPDPWTMLAHALSFAPVQGAATHEREALMPHDTAPAAHKSWLERLDDWFARQRQREREAYLSEAHDIFDLEERIRRLERSASPM